jgi:hypothetical protein
MGETAMISLVLLVTTIGWIAKNIHDIKDDEAIEVSLEELDGPEM